ncbi:MAG: A/G-specific adenine glycosylase [Actinomycetota bacterium]|nr:A/G-specific adenine glycosylase [Actinomycetota bacterium]
MSAAPLHRPVLEWYDACARDLPWRAPGTSPWAVLVSEVMLQQTPVARVQPVYGAWLARWPGPVELAAAAPGEAIRQWGRLGYPRRALRLHECARVLVERHGGQVPRELEALRALPGVGDYTACAVAAFAFGQPVAVVDTNVRRVLARAMSGAAHAAPSLTRAEHDLAAAAVPSDGTAPRWAVAVMELGALVCQARAPRCDACPIAASCAWRLAGAPEHTGPRRRGQAWTRTDRQARGALLAVLRSRHDGASESDLAAAWDEPVQRGRALASLAADGLVERTPDRRWRLPGALG